MGGHNSRIGQEFQPEHRFVGFFHDNAHSRNKLGMRSGPAHGSIIRGDCGTAAQQLFSQDVALTR
jgi:hypothetical protein